MSLFQLGSFDLHSGGTARWKIDCDALTDGDLEAVALMIAERLPVKFGSVYGIPWGGVRIAQKLWGYASKGGSVMTSCAEFSGPVLIVDDVLTTGASMEEAREQFNEAGKWVFGAVIFARGRCPGWIMPLFAMHTVGD